MWARCKAMHQTLRAESRWRWRTGRNSSKVGESWEKKKEVSKCSTVQHIANIWIVRNWKTWERHCRNILLSGLGYCEVFCFAVVNISPLFMEASTWVLQGKRSLTLCLTRSRGPLKTAVTVLSQQKKPEFGLELLELHRTTMMVPEYPGWNA